MTPTTQKRQNTAGRGGKSGPVSHPKLPQITLEPLLEADRPKPPKRLRARGKAWFEAAWASPIASTFGPSEAEGVLRGAEMADALGRLNSTEDIDARLKVERQLLALERALCLFWPVARSQGITSAISRAADDPSESVAAPVDDLETARRARAREAARRVGGE